MPKGTNQKLKLYRLAQIMLEKTDEEHYITMPEIMEELSRYDITADRKSIYNDLGKWYHISPWGLLWDDENYYMIGFDSEAQKIKHYRVDKMLKISLSEEAREGKESFTKLDMADYAKKSFGMYGGKEEKVKLLVHNSLVGVMIDRFGRDIMLIPADEEHVTVNVDVRISRQFLAWVFSLGPQVQILGPEEVVKAMKAEGVRLIEQYGM